MSGVILPDGREIGRTWCPYCGGTGMAYEAEGVERECGCAGFPAFYSSPVKPQGKSPIEKTLEALRRLGWIK